MNDNQTVIFFDESGYTGEDLFNASQPVFTIASLNIPESVCQEIKNRHFSRVQSVELKHTSLARRPSQQKMLLEFLSEMQQYSDQIKISVAVKRYVLVCKIVDLLIETLAHIDGIDLYKRGGNIALANLYYFLIPSLKSKEYFLNVISSFQQMMLERTSASYKTFFDLIYQKDLPNELNELFIFLKAFHERLGFKFLSTLPQNLLEIAHSCALTLVQSWSESISDTYIITHDRSSEMSRKLNLWEKIVNPDVVPTIAGYDRRKASYPLRVHRTDLKDSKDSAGLQLADVIAGAVTKGIISAQLSDDELDEYSKNLLKVLEGFPLAHSIQPELKFTPDELGTIGEDGIDPNDFLAELFKK